MVLVSALSHAEFGLNYHREDAPLHTSIVSEWSFGEECPKTQKVIFLKPLSWHYKKPIFITNFIGSFDNKSKSEIIFVSLKHYSATWLKFWPKIQPMFWACHHFFRYQNHSKNHFQIIFPSWPNFVSKWVGNGQSRVRQCSHISPHWTITTGTRGLFDPSVGIFSTLRTISIPSSITFPNTTCFWSRKSHFVHVMKNWHPFVCLPEFAK